MTTRAERLAAYVQARAALRFQWGVNDCALFVHDWVQGETAIELMDAPLRDYASGPAAVELLGARGGLIQCFGDLGRTAGFVETTSPAIGDIAVIQAGRPVCTIFSDAGFVSVASRGISIAPAWSTIFRAFTLPVD